MIKPFSWSSLYTDKITLISSVLNRSATNFDCFCPTLNSFFNPRCASGHRPQLLLAPYLVSTVIKVGQAPPLIIVARRYLSTICST